MSPKEQRIAIATACGGTISDKTKFRILGNPDDEYSGGCCAYSDHFGTDTKGGEDWIPDYLNDLNAMYEAERFAGEHLMDADQWEEYGHALERIHPSACLKTSFEEKVDYYDFATLMTDLTAAQRAEAFLRTLGLWKDDACPQSEVSTTAQPSSKNESLT